MKIKNKKIYKTPTVQEYVIDGDISLVLMSWTDPDNPPGGEDPVPTAAATQSSALQENPFDENNLQ
ncbi:hypothetical protein J1N10_08610 [Carboxylicivirga sp. A043]|uniref:hypothetical protein n=1 Tax=Carboxylicivirga litoralis TaxID=2816963 RepID=UPI0021CB02FC|nr:hypothetical protein [Carboxylicivirga sp. A043]MCU4156037.1 hypothetical protein [Carboxylicivirga sp. A043]